jgi:hypothetical protein
MYKLWHIPQVLWKDGDIFAICFCNNFHIMAWKLENNSLTVYFILGEMQHMGFWLNKQLP